MDAHDAPVLTKATKRNAPPADDRGCDPPPPPEETGTTRRTHVASAPAYRYSDRPVAIGARIAGALTTSAICLLIVGMLLFRWGSAPVIAPPADLSIFDVSEPAAPPTPSIEIPPGPEQEQRDESAAKDMPAPPVPMLPLPSLSAAAAPAERPVPDPGPPVERTTAPETRPAPPATKSSDARPSWEGRVLAALNKVKRYPREASRNGQQGTPWIRFVIDRSGKVRSARLERSSGFDALDREAVALAKRAEPLPPPPDSVPGERIELVLPVEFFTG